MIFPLRTGAVWGVGALLTLAACSSGAGPSASTSALVSAVSSTSPAPTASPIATPSTPGITVSAWREVEPNPLAGITNIVGVGSSGSGFVITIAQCRATSSS